MNTPSLIVFAPSPILTITVEDAGSRRQEIHLHAGGQGVWVARMATLLGSTVALCCALGGETGAVLRGLISEHGIHLLEVGCAAPNGAYIHSRHEGVREQIAQNHCRGLTRHESDELYGVALSAGLDAALTMLTGVDPPGVLDSDVYRRLAGDLRRNGAGVIADLSGPPLHAALEGGVDLLKVSEDELPKRESGHEAGGGRPEALFTTLDRLHGSGAEVVLISRGEMPALVRDRQGGYLELASPRVETLEPRGTGDSMFAAIGSSLAAGDALEDALRLGMAAGCLNATRRGLGTGTREQIEQLSRHIDIAALVPRPTGSAQRSEV